MSLFPTFKSRYHIDGVDDDNVDEPELSKQSKKKYQQKAKSRKLGRSSIYNLDIDKGNNYRGCIIIFGTTQFIKAKCPKCEDVAFVNDSFKFLCCGAEYEHEPVSIENGLAYTAPRKKPGLKAQREILRGQGFCCLYCDRTFAEHYEYRGELIKLTVEWDHLLPYSYTGCSHDSQFVAACNVCNRNKSNLIFKSLDDAKEYLQSKWSKS